MSPSLTCPELKIQYDRALFTNLELNKLFETFIKSSDLNAIKETLQKNEIKVLELIRSTDNAKIQLQLVNAVFNHDLNDSKYETIITDFNGDIASVLVCKEDEGGKPLPGRYFFYNLITKEKDFQFYYIERGDVNGFWYVREEDGNYLYNPSNNKKVKAPNSQIYCNPDITGTWTFAEYIGEYEGEDRYQFDYINPSKIKS